MKDNIDAVCLIHGKKHSEHKCLFCCLCFEPLTVEQCALLPDGKREDTCVKCAMQERERLPHEFQKRSAELTKLKSDVARLNEAETIISELLAISKYRSDMKVSDQIVGLQTKARAFLSKTTNG